MEKPELGQRVQLLRRVSRCLFTFLDTGTWGNASERNALRLDALGTYVRLVCAYVREKKKELESHMRARVSMPCTKSQLELYLRLWLSIMSLDR